MPWEHGAQALRPDHARFQQLMAGAVRRFPFLEDAGVIALVCHPDAMTPDGNPLLGPMPGVRGLWAAAGLSLNGFGGAGGLGKALAELVTEGEAEVDVQPYRPWRFGGPYRDADFAAATAREVYKYYYRLRYPLDVSQAGRPRRLSPLHERLEALGAVFGTKNGWERAEYFRPGEPPRRAGEDQRTVGWARPPWYDRVAVEHRAIRERLGIVDMTSFGKLETGDVDVLERVCDNRIDRPVGSVVYTQLVDERGCIVGDVTVTRLAADRFRVVTGAGAVDSDRGFLELNGASVDDVTDELAVIGIWGPEARAALASVTELDVSNDAFPFRTAKELEFGLAQRISVRRRAGLRALRAPRAGRRRVGCADRGRVAGARRLPGARLAADREGLPLLHRHERIGDAVRGRTSASAWRAASCRRLPREPPLRLRTLLVGGRDYLTVYGGEAVHAEGRVVGRVRSAAYGFTVERNVALAKIPAAPAGRAEVRVDVMGELVQAVVVDALTTGPLRRTSETWGRRTAPPRVASLLAEPFVDDGHVRLHVLLGRLRGIHVLARDPFETRFWSLFDGHANRFKTATAGEPLFDELRAEHLLQRVAGVRAPVLGDRRVRRAVVLTALHARRQLHLDEVELRVPVLGRPPVEDDRLLLRDQLAEACDLGSLGADGHVLEFQAERLDQLGVLLLVRRVAAEEHAARGLRRGEDLLVTLDALPRRERRVLLAAGTWG